MNVMKIKLIACENIDQELIRKYAERRILLYTRNRNVDVNIIRNNIDVILKTTSKICMMNTYLTYLKEVSQCKSMIIEFESN